MNKSIENSVPLTDEQLDQVNGGKEGMPEGPEKKVYRECQFCHCSFLYHNSYDKRAFDEHELVCGGSQPL